MHICLQALLISAADSRTACSNTSPYHAGNGVDVDMAVEAVGAGFYVRAHVVTRLALSCDCCLATFEQPVDTHFEVRRGTMMLPLVGCGPAHWWCASCRGLSFTQA